MTCYDDHNCTDQTDRRVEQLALILASTICPIPAIILNSFVLYLTVCRLPTNKTHHFKWYVGNLCLADLLYSLIFALGQPVFIFGPR